MKCSCWKFPETRESGVEILPETRIVGNLSLFLLRPSSCILEVQGKSPAYIFDFVKEGTFFGCRLRRITAYPRSSPKFARLFTARLLRDYYEYVATQWHSASLGLSLSLSLFMFGFSIFVGSEIRVVVSAAAHCCFFSRKFIPFHNLPLVD